MVTATIDPIRMPVVSLSIKELDEIAELIDAGQLPKDFLERHFEAVDANVFGVDAPKVRGQRQEVGLGSPRNQTANSIAAYIKYCNPANPKAIDPDPNFEKNLEVIQAQLAACNADRKDKATTLRERYTGRKGRKA